MINYNTPNFSTFDQFLASELLFRTSKSEPDDNVSPITRRKCQNHLISLEYFDSFPAYNENLEFDVQCDILGPDFMKPISCTAPEEPSSVLADTDTNSVKSNLSVPEAKTVQKQDAASPPKSEIQSDIKFINAEMHEKAIEELPDFHPNDQTRFDVVYKTSLRMMRRFFAESFRSFLKPFEEKLKVKAYNHKNLYNEKISEYLNEFLGLEASDEDVTSIKNLLTMFSY